jgi:beta-lactamase class A
MAHSRREFLRAAGTAAVTGTPLAATTAGAFEAKITPEDVVQRFMSLPGEKAVKIFAPAAADKPEFSVALNSDKTLFVASAFKTFVLGEALRRADSHDVMERLEARMLALDSSVWSLGSPIFNPPHLSGTVSERTALEAMITRSDNTATDMILKLVGANNVRRFVASADLRHTLIPDSTRAFAGYLFGAENYLTITWEELLDLVQGQPVRPLLNDVQTLASSADDLASYYARALQGDFFQHRGTLQEFRRILTLCDFIYLVPLPLGVSAYAKSGNADIPGFHARSIAGGLYFDGHWVYFAFIINWAAAAGRDEETVARFFAAIHWALGCITETRLCLGT